MVVVDVVVVDVVDVVVVVTAHSGNTKAANTFITCVKLIPGVTPKHSKVVPSNKIASDGIISIHIGPSGQSTGGQ